MPVPIPMPAGGRLDRFAVSCSGTAYLALNWWPGTTPSQILEYDLKGKVATSVPVDIRVDNGAWHGIDGMALDCHTNDVLGFTGDYVDTRVWTSSAGGAATPVTPTESLAHLIVYQDMAVAPDGTIYVAVDDYNDYDGNSHAIGFVHLNKTVVPCTAATGATGSGTTPTSATRVAQPLDPAACLPTAQGSLPACTLGSAQLYCLPAAPAAPIAILPSTKGWRPQREPGQRADPSNPNGPPLADPDPFVINLGSGVQLNAAATVSVTGPGGTVDIPVTLTGSSPTGPYTYSAQVAGIWTYTDPSDNLLKPWPANFYNFIVKATYGTSQTPVQSDPYDPQANPDAHLAVVEVSKVEVVQCGPSGSLPTVTCKDGGARLDDNKRADGTLMPGGGKAAFPDAIAQGSAFRRTVLVRATLTPDLGQGANQVPVYFQAIDVDDPSSSQAPIDDDSRATSSGDNVSDTFTIATTSTAIPGVGGLAWFRVSTQQGNNYRLAASTYQSWLTTLCGVVSSDRGAVQHQPCPPPPPPATPGGPIPPQAPSPMPQDETNQVSDMLTVWRTLHVELDKLDTSQVQQATLGITGFWTKVGGKKLEDTNRSFFDLWHPEKDDWVGAILNPYAPGENPSCIESITVRCPFRIKSNKEHEVKTDTSGVDSTAIQNAPPNSPDRAYYLREDDLREYGRRQHDITMLRRILERGYIRTIGHPDPGNPSDTLNANPLIPWSNTIDGALDERSILGASRDIRNSEASWAVQLILGFEGLHPALTIANERGAPNRQVSTNDPTQDATTGLFGLTVPSPPNPIRDLGNTLWLQYQDQPVSVSFPETIRDATATLTNDRIRPTTPVATIYVTDQTHEVLHALTLGHDGGLMCATLTDYSNPAGLDITMRQLAKLRGILRPDALTSPDVACPGPGNDLVNCCPSR